VTGSNPTPKVREEKLMRNRLQNPNQRAMSVDEKRGAL
jgi:hypothetical protein